MPMLAATCCGRARLGLRTQRSARRHASWGGSTVRWVCTSPHCRVKSCAAGAHRLAYVSAGVHRSVHLALLQYGQVATGSGKSPPYSGAQPDPDGSLAEGYSGKDVLDFNIRQLCFARVSAKAGQPWLWW
eukprot:scaffold76923_cov22-Tisochrysis_lutea.AAC.1